MINPDLTFYDVIKEYPRGTKLYIPAIKNM